MIITISFDTDNQKDVKVLKGIQQLMREAADS